MDKDEISAVNELAKTINAFKGPVMWFIVVVLFIVAITYIVLKILAKRREDAMERSRQLRSDREHGDMTALRDNIQNLGSSIYDHLTSERTANETRDSILNGLDETMGEVKECLVAVMERQDGRINKLSSERVIQSKFKEIKSGIALIIERQLVENNYDRNKEHIARRVRTDISKVLAEARSDLSLLDLTIEHQPYFTLQPEHGVERFLLCDLVWNRLEPLFNEHENLKQRIEESKVLIDNTISDYLVGIRAQDEQQRREDALTLERSRARKRLPGVHQFRREAAVSAEADVEGKSE